MSDSADATIDVPPVLSVVRDAISEFIGRDAKNGVGLHVFSRLEKAGWTLANREAFAAVGIMIVGGCPADKFIMPNALWFADAIRAAGTSGTARTIQVSSGVERVA